MGKRERELHKQKNVQKENELSLHCIVCPATPTPSWDSQHSSTLRLPSEAPKRRVDGIRINFSRFVEVEGFFFGEFLRCNTQFDAICSHFEIKKLLSIFLRSLFFALFYNARCIISPGIVDNSTRSSDFSVEKFQQFFASSPQLVHVCQMPNHFSSFSCFTSSTSEQTSNETRVERLWQQGREM